MEDFKASPYPGLMFFYFHAALREILQTIGWLPFFTTNPFLPTGEKNRIHLKIWMLSFSASVSQSYPTSRTKHSLESGASNQ